MKKLNARGIAHYVLPVAVIVIVGIGGVAALVASHADSVCQSNNLSRTKRSCTGLDQISCSISGLPSTTPKFGTVLRPKVTIISYGSGTVHFTVYNDLIKQTPDGQNVNISTTHVNAKLVSGKPYVHALKTYKVVHDVAAHDVHWRTSFKSHSATPDCEATVALPKMPPNPAPKPSSGSTTTIYSGGN